MVIKAKDRIVQEALALPRKDRAAIVAKLWASTQECADDDLDQKEIDRLWGEESDRRFEAGKRGEIESISSEEVLRALNRKVRK